MLTATLLALGAAVLHAGWNLWVKQSGDRWMALWGQMFAAGAMCAGILVVVGIATGSPVPEDFLWWPVLASGVIHLYYVVALARAYDIGDFSVTYPIARGTGALLAAAGGLVFLDDSLSPVAAVGILVAVAGMVLLAGRADTAHVHAGLVVAATVGLYSLVDSHGSRANGGNMYPLYLFVSIAAFLTLHGVMAGKREQMTEAMRTMWPRYALAGAASALTYWMVLLAVQQAPVGYVTALRESSVVLVALLGTRYLGEEHMRRRLVAATIVAVGLVVLVLG